AGKIATLETEPCQNAPFAQRILYNLHVSSAILQSETESVICQHLGRGARGISRSVRIYANKCKVGAFQVAAAGRGARPHRETTAEAFQPQAALLDSPHVVGPRINQGYILPDARKIASVD